LHLTAIAGLLIKHKIYFGGEGVFQEEMEQARREAVAADVEEWEAH